MNTSPKAIYGAGLYGRALSRAMRAAGQEPACFIDAYTASTEIDGVPVLRPSDADRRATVYVSVALTASHRATSPDLAAELRSAGFAAVYDFVETARAFPDILTNIASHEFTVDAFSPRRDA